MEFLDSETSGLFSFYISSLVTQDFSVIDDLYDKGAVAALSPSSLGTPV
jgi:hypothetical protein